jgi:hypothetical protein
MTPSDATPAETAPAETAPAELGGLWCGYCGESVGDRDHSRCVRQPELEPPRFCAQCRRRMKVQVIPGAWTATCVEHGTLEQSTWG